MRISDYIYKQVDGFNNAGKKLVKPKNDAERVTSKILAVIFFVLAVLFYGSMLNTGYSIPLRIHVRAWIYLIPWLTMVYRLYKGVSISWVINGILKYWMVPLMLVWIYLVLMNMLYVIFFEGDSHDMLISASFMTLYTGIMYFVYFSRKAKEYAAYYVMVLFMSVMIIGGLAMFLWGAGILDWFVVDVLGW